MFMMVLKLQLNYTAIILSEVFYKQFFSIKVQFVTELCHAQCICIHISAKKQHAKSQSCYYQMNTRMMAGSGGEVVVRLDWQSIPFVVPDQFFMLYCFQFTVYSKSESIVPETDNTAT